MSLEPVYVFYGILLAGSLAFGLEALLIGLGGRMYSLYRRQPKKLIKMALPIGLAIAGLSIGLASAFELGPLFLAAMLLVFTFLSGRIIRTQREVLFPQRAPPIPDISSEKEVREIKSMLRNRGFDDFVKEEETDENHGK